MNNFLLMMKNNSNKSDIDQDDKILKINEILTIN